ncbi:MAG: efflux RND transporter periplasmic adaptor subunit [Fidelibacterota bacterium]
MNKILRIIRNINGKTWGIVGIAFFIGLWIGLPGEEENHTHSAGIEEVEAWTCSMHPIVNLPEPGQCPICFMDLIPLKTSAVSVLPNQLSLSEDAVKLADIETSVVVREIAEMNIRLSGKVEYDETKIGNITAWVPGRLERMFVDYTGITVNEGDHMVELYSPDLYSAQEELIQARKLIELNGNHSSLIQRTAQTTLDAAREKLRLLGLMEDQIKTIETSDKPSNLVTVYSPMTGVVIKKNGVEGAYVKTGTNIYTIADLSRVWVILDAYERDLPWLIFGQTVTFNTESVPGKKFEGKIAFIDPVLDPKSRTVKVRINILNPDGELKPGMFVQATVLARIDAEGKAINPEFENKWVCPMHPEVVKEHKTDCDICGMDLVKSETLGIVHSSENDHKNILVPASAVLKTGERAIVYVKIEGETSIFEGREVVLGSRVKDAYIVKSGLSEGELVVTRGNFKIDSAMQISAKRSMMNPKGGPSGMGHNHNGNMPIEQKHELQSMDKYESNESFQKAIKLISDAYFVVQTALSKDNFKDGKTAMFALNTVVTAVQEKDFGLDENAFMKWNEIQMSILGLTEHAQHWQRIDVIRDAFRKVSLSMVSLEESFGHSTGDVYYEVFCPMAFGNEGAVWLTNKKDINNPYFGEKMLNCGEVKKEFKSIDGK